ncbi:MAG: aldehyde dehydrogenase family protein, partial [Pseudomonadota bacterium]
MSSLEANLERLGPHLARFRQKGVLNRIGGVDAPGSGPAFQSISPIDKSVIADVARGTSEDIDQAAKAAHGAFADWRDMPATKRRRIMIAIAEGIEARAEEIALCECW